MEPSVNPDLVGAVVVPDGSIDPFRLTASNMMDATEKRRKNVHLLRSKKFDS
ncbi:sn-glycerol-3-phosphate dehydrogenase (anaerobic), large subunit, FAD/NAD(P)-binding [Haemophilus influenzae]|uniref:sn-glycerol-3-phosphate dehydrogenase (Anaerobic), large subunit, FAD/NAD(P)-binding n=1 Tax=Haemophilus influenzae TaxID=727 RepID=A0A2X1PW42_HAEIF|nr:sn-glycerol-3-phosphate dehydrogenase (anaerobic), large subunit, FAD/NAD(P)-binding [Haemophilus influenzae]